MIHIISLKKIRNISTKTGSPNRNQGQIIANTPEIHIIEALIAKLLPMAQVNAAQDTGSNELTSPLVSKLQTKFGALAMSILVTAAPLQAEEEKQTTEKTPTTQSHSKDQTTVETKKQSSTIASNEKITKDTALSLDKIAKLSQDEFRAYVANITTFEEIKKLDESMLDRLKEMRANNVPEDLEFAFEDLEFIAADRRDELHKQRLANYDKIIAQQEKDIAQQEKDIQALDESISSLQKDAKSLKLIKTALNNLNQND